MTTPAPRQVLTDVLIVGAGIVGLSAAIWLQRAGCRVTLIDKTGPGAGASFGNGGILAACSVVPVTVPGLWKKAPLMALDPNQPLFLRWSYLPKLAPWLLRYMAQGTVAKTRATAQAIAGLTLGSLQAHQDMAAGTGAEKYVHPSDYLFLYRDRAQFQADAFGWGLRAEAGFQWQELDRAAIAQADPAFGPEIGFAARLGGHGYISDPGAYCTALAAHVQGAGGQVLRATVSDVITEGGRVTGVVANGTPLHGDAVVLTAGAWSGPLARRMGVAVPLETERGYHLDLWEPSVTLRNPVMVAGGKFVMTPMEGRLRLAGIVEFGGLDAPPARAPFDLLLKNAKAALPGLRFGRAEEWMGHRPAPADSVPVIGPVPGLAGAFMGFGHHHIGMTAGPTTGKLLSGQIIGQQTNLDLAPYAPRRFE